MSLSLHGQRPAYVQLPPLFQGCVPDELFVPLPVHFSLPFVFLKAGTLARAPCQIRANSCTYLTSFFHSAVIQTKKERTAAKLKYSALDNPLIAVASKEASRSMSSPRQGEKVKLKRILRFLQKKAHNDVPIRVAGSSRRIDWVHRQ